MQKDFDNWNKEKKNLETVGYATLPFHERTLKTNGAPFGAPQLA